MLLERLRSKLALRRKRAGFRSRFGGLWTDRAEAGERVRALLAQGELSPEEAGPLERWIEDGYVILPGAVPGDVIDRINADVEEAWRTLNVDMRVEVGGKISPLMPSLRGPRCKLVDLHVHSSAALEAAFAEPLRAFLTRVFERPPHLFQGLSFEYGSLQPIHQDPAYVVVDSPLELAAAWIALEDIQPGSGELEYYRGSHRLDEHLFRGGYRNFNRERDGEDGNRRYLEGLVTRADALGLERQSFLPKKGDVLVWNADLAHGGGAVTDPELTRKSFVCHYCPSGVRPYYFSYQSNRRTIRSVGSGGTYSSTHYPL